MRVGNLFFLTTSISGAIPPFSPDLSSLSGSLELLGSELDGLLDVLEVTPLESPTPAHISKALKDATTALSRVDETIFESKLAPQLTNFLDKLEPAITQLVPSLDALVSTLPGFVLGLAQPYIAVMPKFLVLLRVIYQRTGRTQPSTLDILQAKLAELNQKALGASSEIRDLSSLGVNLEDLLSGEVSVEEFLLKFVGSVLSDFQVEFPSLNSPTSILRALKEFRVKVGNAHDTQFQTSSSKLKILQSMLVFGLDPLVAGLDQGVDTGSTEIALILEGCDEYLALMRVLDQKLKLDSSPKIKEAEEKLAELKKKKKTSLKTNNNSQGDEKSNTLVIAGAVGGAALVLGGAMFFWLRMKN